MIDLDAPGAILFFGTMNAMPMMYARELRRLGQDVIYFVDVPPDDALSRPECHYADIAYPYPDWIVEFPLATQLLANLFPKAVLKRMLRAARARYPFVEIKCVFMGGSFIALAPHLPKDAIKIFLSYGSDFEVWCNSAEADSLFRGMRTRSIFRFLPAPVARVLLGRILTKNYAAARCADVLLYFPRGMNKAGDRLITQLEEDGVRYIPRYDIPFDKLASVDRTFKSGTDKLVILSPVRFLYRTFNEGNAEYSKGNDKIIHGLARFKSIYPNIEIHFFEKGDDVKYAKRLCDELDLSHVVIWHEPLPFTDLLNLYGSSDICFDQVGNHIIGSGMYALYLGKPLIANSSGLTFLGETPIMSASTADEVFERLRMLSDPAFRKDVSDRSKAFAEAEFGPDAVINRLVSQKTPPDEPVSFSPPRPKSLGET